MNRRLHLLHGLGWLLAAVAIIALVLIDVPPRTKTLLIPVAVCVWFGVMALAQAALGVDE